jgi:hypothetical protein
MKCMRIYADDQGESHFEELDVPLGPVGEDPGYLVSTAVSTTEFQFRISPPGKNFDWHTAPAPTLVVFCDGVYEFETSSGGKRRLDPPSLVFADATRGKGYRARLLSDRPTLAIFIPIPHGFPGRITKTR